MGHRELSMLFKIKGLLNNAEKAGKRAACCRSCSTATMLAWNMTATCSGGAYHWYVNRSLRDGLKIMRRRFSAAVARDKVS